MNIEARKKDNASLALTQIRRLIEAGDLMADGRLPTERDLSVRFSVGRRAVRRALEALETEGLIWRRQGKGTFIGQPPDPTGLLAAELSSEMDPLSVMEARMCIEPALAELCAQRASLDDVKRLRHLAERTRAAADSDAAELWDGALHRLIARTAGNRLLLTAFSLLDEVRVGENWQQKRQQARTPETRAHYDFQHCALIDAIERGDGAAARAAMVEHLDELSRTLRHALEQGVS